MKYNEILKKIAKDNNSSKKAVEAEMERALRLAGVNCSVKEFIENAANNLQNRLYII